MGRESTVKTVRISCLETNKGQLEGLPKNPRFIRDSRFEALKRSIKDAPEMLELRELLVYPLGKDRYIIIGGNMRYRACVDLGYAELPVKVIPKEVPSPSERLRAIERIANADAGGATLRLRPFIIGITTPSYLDLIEDAAAAGATAMSTEFFCVEIRSTELRRKMPIFNELCGFDLFEFYRKYSVGQGYLRLNRKVKEPFIRRMKEKAEEVGIRFYVSDAHFKELSCNGSCCGLPPSWNYSRGQFCEALMIAKKNGVVKWNDIKDDVIQLHRSYEWGRAQGYNCGSSEKRAHFAGMSMADYMKWLWNNPQNGQSPYTLFEGALVPEKEKDEDGNLVYRYNGSKL